MSNGQWTQITVWADSVNMGYYINGNQHSGSKSHGLTGDIPSVGNAKVPLSLMTLYPYGSDGSGWAGLATHATAGKEQIELLEPHKDGIMVAEYWTELPSKNILEEKLHQSFLEARERLIRKQLK